MSTTTKNQAAKSGNSVEAVMATTNADSKNIATVEAQLYDVVKMKMRSPKTGFRAAQNSFGIWKAEGGDCLGVVGKGTIPTQPKFLLSAVLNTALQTPGVFDLSTLKFRERNGGSRIEFSVKMAPIVVPTKLKVDDVTEVELLFSTSYNNEQANRIEMLTTRCVCDNQMVMKFRSSSLTVKNTKNSEGQIEKYFYDIAKILDEVDVVTEEMIKLAGTKVNDNDIERLICKTFELHTNVEDRKSREINRHISIMESVNLEIERTGKTAFGLMQGITHYINHVVGADKDADYCVTGNGNKWAQRMQKHLMPMVK